MENARGPLGQRRNFRSQLTGQCNADVQIGHVSTATTLLGDIAHKTGSLLEWDGQAERFINNESANRLLSYKYRRRISWGEAAGSPSGWYLHC
jgi:hypothetical protein